MEHPKSKDLKVIFPHHFQPTKIADSAFIAEGAMIMGDVWIGELSSIWYNCVLRGDVNKIRIGERTNIQDLTMVHVSYQTFPTIIGDDVTIGHSAVIHACTIGNNTLIGMGSILLDGCEIGDNVILGAGSLVTQGMKIPSNSKAFGRPAKVVATLTEKEIEAVEWSAEHYVRLAEIHKKQLGKG
jgi:carbonic anhydrase/acetyltransferase-like protein (isoleucine patch superfamily)